MTDTNTVHIANAIDQLVGEWRQRLLDVDSLAAHDKPSSDRWSVSEVVGHLIDSACNNHQRFVRAQFADALQFPKYDQNDWVSAAGYSDLDWKLLVSLWCDYNRMLAGVIRNIPDRCLDVPCTITPYEPCTLAFLVADYLEHLQHHLRILDKRI